MYCTGNNNENMCVGKHQSKEKRVDVGNALLIATPTIAVGNLQVLTRA